MTDPGAHLFWITSRAAGATALVLASVAVATGLLMGTRLVRGTRAGDLRALHEVLSLATLVAIAVHALSLLGDAYLRPSVLDVLVPLAGAYQRVWTSLGIVAGWSLAALGLAYYARRHIGVNRWRTAHRFTALAWIGGIVHAIGEGTDAGQTWFIAMLAIVVLPTLALLAARLAGVRRRVPVRPPRPVVSR